MDYKRRRDCVKKALDDLYVQLMVAHEEFYDTGRNICIVLGLDFVQSLY